jgi:hypothetical protein
MDADRASGGDRQRGGATPGQQVVVNQNWDPGWSVDGARALDYRDAIAARITTSTQSFHFRYRPPLWWAWCALFVATVAALLFGRRASRRLTAGGPASGRRRADPAPPP